MNKPDLTIVLPALNSIQYIKQCLDSIVGQTFTNFELLCVDAGSTDGTLEVFHAYASRDSRIRVIPSDQKSYGHQVNLGLDAAQGNYLGIVESDDFLDPDMYASLMGMSRDGTIDVIKGNFYDYFEYDGMDPVPAPNGQRRKMPANGTVFTVNQYPHILEGHPSIWSAIYRTGFLREKGFRFMELPGGGWTDNPFFFQTLCSAQSIAWTAKPYYYYRRNNPESSSNRITDLTLPLRRMMDNLDVTEHYDLNDQVLAMVYERAIYYLNGSLKDANSPAQESQLREWALRVYPRLEKRIIDNEVTAEYREIYYNYITPLLLKRPAAGKILIYDYLPGDKDRKFLNLPEEKAERILRLLEKRYDVDIYLLAVRGGTDLELSLPRFEKLENRYSQKLFSYEVVNSPLLTEEIYQRFLELLGPFDIQCFPTDQGLGFLPAIDADSIVTTYMDLMNEVQNLPLQEDITLSEAEYRLLLMKDDAMFRLLESNYKGEIWDSAGYRIFFKIYSKYLRIRGAYRCCREHGVKYTLKLFLTRTGS